MHTTVVLFSCFNYYRKEISDSIVMSVWRVLICVRRVMKESQGNSIEKLWDIYMNSLARQGDCNMINLISVSTKMYCNIYKQETFLLVQCFENIVNTFIQVDCSSVCR